MIARPLAPPRARPGLLAGLVTVLLALAPPALSAQEIRVAGVQGWTSHELLDRPAGLDVGIGVPVGNRWSVELGYAWSTSRFESFGSTCVGLVNPNWDCGGEVRVEEGWIRSISVSAPVVVHEPGRVVVALTPTVLGASVSSTQIGERTERSRSAGQRMTGVGLGAEFRVPLAERGPLHLRVSASASWLLPWRSEAVVDGYTPFQGTLRVSEVGVGVGF